MQPTLRWTSFAIAAAIACLSAGPAAAQWKWRDRAGHVQYSDLPPPLGTADRDILQKPANATRRVEPLAASAPPSAAPLLLPAARASDPELEAARKRAEQQAAEKKKAEDDRQAAARADNCARAQEAKRTIDSGIRITRTNLQGEREYLDDAARAAEARRAQQTIATDCR